MMPLRTCALTANWTRLPGARAIRAPTRIWNVNRREKKGAWRKLADTDFGVPVASAMAKEVESGPTEAANSEAPSGPKPRSAGAARPASRYRHKLPGHSK